MRAGGVNALYKATSNGRLQANEILLSPGVRVDSCDGERGWRPLCHAASNGIQYAARAVLDAGTESDSLAAWALHVVVGGGDSEVVLWLLTASGYTSTTSTVRVVAQRTRTRRASESTPSGCASRCQRDRLIEPRQRGARCGALGGWSLLGTNPPHGRRAG